MTRGLAYVGALWLIAGCSVGSVAEQQSAIPQNECSSNADCPVGTCETDICRTLKGTFDTLLFEVTPPADTMMIGGIQFLKPVTDVLKSNGVLDLNLDLVAQLNGEVTVPGRSCSPKFLGPNGVLATANDDSIPARISVIPATSALGLFSPPASTQSAIPNGSTWDFKINVTPGDYDIYVEPQTQPDADCVVPPQLLRGHSITGTVNLNIALPEPQTFALHVSWPHADGALDDWSADMLDPITGRAISNSVKLVASSNAQSYVANLSYSPVVGDQASADQLVRLSPPPGVTAPTLLFARSGLGLFSSSIGTVTQFTSLPTPVHVAGAVTAMSTPVPLAATVTLVATKITGVDPGVLASFVRTVTAATDGNFELDVLPGTYRVSAVPTGTSNPADIGFAEVSTEWVVGTSPSVQAGKVIELSPTLGVQGVAVDPSGTTNMAGASVQAVASPASITTDVLHQALGETVLVPRATGATVDSDGNFKLRVDSGTYDFSVRPRASSNYAWLVIPGVSVGTTPATSAGLGLATLTLPLPVRYTGALTVPGASVGARDPVPGALISAYIYMKEGAYTTDASHADAVLEIAEARSDETGAFTLLIPAVLNEVPAAQ